MLIFNQQNINLIGIFLGIFYTLYFNWQVGQYPISSTIAYSIPFLIFSALIAFAISKIRKDKYYGIYFAVICLIFVTLIKGL
jgi:hypothetical protein